MGHDTFKAGNLTAVIGDNEAYEGQRGGFNGIHRLVHAADPIPLFEPGISGLNLEHIFDGYHGLRDRSDAERKIYFEPRNAPMVFRKVSEAEAELHQPPTPAFHLESWTRFKLIAPHYVDFSFRCRPHRRAFQHGYIGLFWASYINGPEDKSIYFRGDGGWLQHFAQTHANQSTVVYQVPKPPLTFDSAIGETLYTSLSPLRFEEPFFFGRVRDMAAVFMFDQAENIRFAHSPNSGTDVLSHPNPAWDFQFVVPRYETSGEYGFRARFVYKKFISRDDILAEFEAWKRSSTA